MAEDKKVKDQKLQAVRLAMEQIEKQYGKGAIMKLGERETTEGIEVIPTGSLGLDLALGVGGIPRGRITEIYGPEASGKTTLALHIIAEAQKRGGTVAFVDVEHALDPAWAKKVGVNLENLLISQPDTAEQALEIAETLIRSGGVDVIVLDSVAALVPKAEIEGEMGDAMIGVQARLMSQAMRKLAGVINKSKTAMIFTNQIRMKIGVMFGNPETTPGGLALKFYSSVRLDMRKIGSIKDPKGGIVGSQHRVRVTKNKVASPFRQAEFDIMGEENGISRVGEVLDLAVSLGIVEKSGAFFRYGKKLIGQGREAAKIFLAETPKITEEIEIKIRQASKISRKKEQLH